ncbi:MAG: glycosyltransferase family 4 protein [Actinomycetaceae bacterium]|nr:glycosyltransferase family 4 protein [Actinomycetaceae bacterium]
MHILILSQLWEPEEGVPQRRWAWLTQALVDAGHTVDVICPPPHYPGGKEASTRPEHRKYSVSRQSSNLAIYRTNFSEHTPQLLTRIVDQTVQMFSSLRIALKAVKHRRPDVIIATAPPLPTIFTQHFIASILGVPRIVDMRDAWPDLLKYMLAGESAVASDQSVGKGLKKYLMLAVARVTETCLSRTLVSADGVITSTATFRKVLENRGCQNVITIRNVASVSPSELNSSSDFAEKRPLRILYAGTVGRAQGLYPTIQAIRQAVKQGANIQMRIIGGGAHLRTIKRYAKRNSLPITFFPRIPFFRMPRYYQWADTEIIHLEPWKPLEWTVPSKLYDALQNSRHITLIAEGESAKIVRSLKAGHCFTPHDTESLVQHFMESSVDRSRLVIGEQGKEWIENRVNKNDTARRFVAYVNGFCNDDNSR